MGNFSERLSIPHNGELYARGSGVTFCDGVETDWHVMRLEAPSCYMRRVKFKLSIRRCLTCTTLLYFAQIGGIDLGFVDLFSGEIFIRHAQSITAELRDDIMTVAVIYTLGDTATIFGSALSPTQPVYAGFGQPQFDIMDASVELERYPSDAFPHISMIDVGAAGGLQPKWDAYSNCLNLVLFDPDFDEFDELNRLTETLPNCNVIPTGLSDADGSHSLYLTRFRECSSILEPDLNVLQRYSVAPLFDVEEVVTINCSRYDSLYAKRLVPSPDFIKIDVQGAQLLVLKGFGDLLHECIAIEVESHFYAIYKGEPSLDDLVQFLLAYGLVLKEIEQCRTFDDDLVEVNAIFMRSDCSAANGEKRDFIESVLGLKHFDLGRKLVGLTR